VSRVTFLGVEQRGDGRHVQLVARVDVLAAQGEVAVGATEHVLLLGHLVRVRVRVRVAVRVRVGVRVRLTTIPCV